MMRVCEEEAYCSSDADMGTTPACVAEKPDDDNCSRNEVDAAWSWLSDQVGGEGTSMRGGDNTWSVAPVVLQVDGCFLSLQLLAVCKRLGKRDGALGNLGK
jgi:hypothetical protein